MNLLRTPSVEDTISNQEFSEAKIVFWCQSGNCMPTVKSTIFVCFLHVGVISS